MRCFLAFGLFALIATLASGEIDGSFASEELNGPAKGSFVPYVENGTPARPGDLPYHVTIYVLRKGQWGFGSGALIAPQWVITEATVLVSTQEVRVYYGSDQLANSGLVQGRRLVVHPKFEPKLRIFNIGLLQLAQPIVASTLVSPVALPPVEFKNAMFDNQYVLISGFGSKNRNGVQRVLQHGTLRITPHAFCKSKFPTLAGPNVFCALPYNRQKNEYPGYGDNGAPIILRYRNTNLLIGLFSFGSPDEFGKGEPAGFMNVAASVDWINAVIKPAAGQ